MVKGEFDQEEWGYSVGTFEKAQMGRSFVSVTSELNSNFVIVYGKYLGMLEPLQEPGIAIGMPLTFLLISFPNSQLEWKVSEWEKGSFPV